MSRSCQSVTLSQGRHRMPPHEAGPARRCAQRAPGCVCGASTTTPCSRTRACRTAPPPHALSVRWSARISVANFSSDAASSARVWTNWAWPVALQYLVRDGRGREANLSADRLLDLRGNACVAAHRSRYLPDRHHLPRQRQPPAVPTHLIPPQRQLETEAHRLRVDPMRAPMHGVAENSSALACNTPMQRSTPASISSTACTSWRLSAVSFTSFEVRP